MIDDDNVHQRHLLASLGLKRIKALCEPEAAIVEKPGRDSFSVRK
jgi:hypothetical protein